MKLLTPILDRVRTWLDVPAPAAPADPPAPVVDNSPKFVSFPLGDGLEYELSLPQGPAMDAYVRAVMAGETKDDTWHFVMDYIRPGDVFFDLGANVGTFSIPAAVRGAGVHAFELLQDNAGHIARAAERNHLNVSVIIGAVWSGPDCVRFWGQSAWGVVDKDGSVSTAALSLDDYVRIRSVPRVDFLKIDIEGSEKQALEGMRGLLDRDKPDIAIECNVITCGNNQYSYRHLLGVLEALGYSIYRFHRRRLSPWSGQVQEVVYADYFATTKSAAQVSERSKWVVSPMTEEEFILELLAQELHNDFHKAYVLAISDELPEFARADERVRALLARLAPLRDVPYMPVLRAGSAAAPPHAATAR